MSLGLFSAPPRATQRSLNERQEAELWSGLYYVPPRGKGEQCAAREVRLESEERQALPISFLPHRSKKPIGAQSVLSGSRELNNKPIFNHGISQAACLVEKKEEKNVQGKKNQKEVAARGWKIKQGNAEHALSLGTRCH